MGLFASSGCGDDGGNTTPDASSIDANKTPDADTTPDAGPSVTDPEGGNMLLEYIYPTPGVAGAFGLNPGDTIARTVGYFINDMQPMQAGNLIPFGSCGNLITGDSWPMYQGDSQTYLDMGDITLSGPDEAGDPLMTVIPKLDPGTDNFGRVHSGSFYQLIQPPVAGALLAHDSVYDLATTGSADIPAFTYTGAFYMPPSMNLGDVGFTGSPAWDDTAVASASDAAGFKVDWQVIDPAAYTNKPAGDVPFSPVLLIDPSLGRATISCPSLSSAGTTTIPKEIIQSYRDTVTAAGGNPDIAVLSRQTILHHPVRLENGATSGFDPANKRRIDFIAVDCWLQVVTVNP